MHDIEGLALSQEGQETHKKTRKRAWIIAFFDADTLSHAMTLTFDLVTLDFYSTSTVIV